MNDFKALIKFLIDGKYILFTMLLCLLSLHALESKYSDEEATAVYACELQQGKWIEIERGGYCD
ncbi:Uncharacterised protein [Phocoenobacter uteri]|uniref:Uncharacterized protein n=1 Tax=Phocoenobacter uteri TaxID=146806 RepID=A0A379C9Q3_9PAST|nr:hypothetical protein [Phocoenobacter uteri]MDG6880976.1 hypothetical protein [Phocoenobacter uteri]SUB58994.1 Uncharacterised protein [Phocoenobacter uteri]